MKLQTKISPSVSRQAAEIINWQPSKLPLRLAAAGGHQYHQIRLVNDILFLHTSDDKTTPGKVKKDKNISTHWMVAIL